MTTAISSGAMRIFALPLTRPAIQNASKTKFKVPPTFYGFRITPPPPKPKIATAPRSFLLQWLPEEGVGPWVSQKASRTWVEWGAAPKGTMKQRAFHTGERLMDTLDFEESNLKMLNLAIAPPLKVDGVVVEASKYTQVPLLYPPTEVSGPESLDHLRALVEERIPMHNRGIAMWIFFAVLSAPLKLIPIIPNFPFYFCAWRTWSHLKAKRAATYLQSLIHNNRIVPTPLTVLNPVYGDEASSVVSGEALGRAAHTLDMPPEEVKELLRAHGQVVTRVEKGSGKAKSS